MQCPKCNEKMKEFYNEFHCICGFKIQNRIAVSWEIEDVLTVAENKGIELSVEDCAAILELVEEKYDANVGINWDVIGTWTDHYLSEKGR